MKYLFRIFSLFLLIMLLTSCNGEKKLDDVPSGVISDIALNKSYLPSLEFKVGEQVIKTYKGVYEWEHTDKKTGEKIGIRTDSLPPYEIVNIEDAVLFDINDAVILDFDIKPSNFEIRLWDEKGVVSTYKSFDEIKEEGKYAFELVAFFDEGRVTYVCALNINK